MHQRLDHNQDARSTLNACRRAYDDPRERYIDVAITLVMVDAMTVVRTKAQALAY